MRSRVRYAVISFLIASVPVALMLLATRGPSESGGLTEPLRNTLIYSVVEWYPWALLAPFIDARVRGWRPKTGAERAQMLAGHAAMASVFLVAHTALTYSVSAGLYPREGRTFLDAVTSGILPTTILYSAIAAGFTIAESRRRQTEIAERLRAEVAEARLDALRQQLNPHFLFNTLNHIVSELRSLRSADVGPALKMLLALSDLLRDVLRERAQLIPLRDEVRIVERYLEIERARFGDRLQAEVTFEPRALDALVPSLLLQPLLENAMKHGVSQADGTCRISLSARAIGERIRIDVRDAGPGMPVQQASSISTTGVGLKNTSLRLRYLYGDDHTFTLTTGNDGGLLVAIELPFKR